MTAHRDSPAAGRPEENNSLHPDDLKRVFRRHPAGVVVITGHGPAGPAGFTATSFVSLSLEPALVCFSVLSTASAWRVLRSVDTVLVHLLGSHQDDVASRFATSGIDRFAEPTRWVRLATGEPLLEGTGSWIRGEVVQRVSLGDHILVVVRPVQARVDDEIDPLVYHDRAYTALQPGERPAPAEQTDPSAGPTASAPPAAT
jgi:flavin reductase (DIM6/NTAB) family NADH-FMN oxidoreductase RutF